MIHWIERGSDLLEARAVLPDGRDVYAGYIAVSPGADRWRAYGGYGFSPVGTGAYGVVQRAVEHRVAEIMRRPHGV